MKNFKAEARRDVVLLLNRKIIQKIVGNEKRTLAKIREVNADE